ncbi:MAG: hypothetical protein R3F59_24160 [Myxococcota bacterium]
MLLLAAATLAHARPPCAQTTTSADLVAGLGAARDAYGDLDLDAFRDAVYDVRLVVPCLADPLTPHDAAEVHRYEGLLGFVERDTDRARRAFAAARAIEPNYRFPESLVPAGNGALTDYLALDPDAGGRERVPLPLDGRLTFDGAPSTHRPLEQPTLVQLFDGSGAITDTAYLWPGEPLPRYAPRPEVEGHGQVQTEGRGGGTPVDALRSGPDRPLLTGAAFTAVAAVGLYAGAFVVHRRYEDVGTPFGTLGALRTTNNALVVGSGAAAGTAVGLGVTAFLVRRF